MAEQKVKVTYIEYGTLVGHNDHVTSIAVSPENPQTIISSSRDRSVMVWRLTPTDSTSQGKAYRSLKGHSHFVQDVVISHDGQFALSGSWDKTLRLWDITKGVSTRLFKGHTQDVMSVAFSSDNRQIVSGSRDNTIKVWNTLGECKFTLEGEEGHKDWVSCVRFSPNTPTIVSGSWDNKVKIWDIKTFKCVHTLNDHEGYVNTVTISPDGSLCASGGKDQQACLWELSTGKALYKLPAGNVINALAFSPNKYWLSAATDDKIIIWDLLTKNVLAEIYPEIKEQASDSKKKKESKSKSPACLSLAWSADGLVLYAGYADGLIRVYKSSNQ